MTRRSFEQDAEACRALLDAIRRDDVEAMAAAIHPEGELVSLLGRVEGGTYRGPEGAREWHRDVIASFDEFDPGEPTFEVVGDAVLVTSRASAQGKASGVPLAWDWVALARVQDGLIGRFAIYADAQTLREVEGIA